MTFRDDCKIEVSAYELSPDAWRAEVSIVHMSSGEVLLPRTTVRESSNTYPSAGIALEAARAYAEAMIACGKFDCSPVPD